MVKTFRTLWLCLLTELLGEKQMEEIVKLWMKHNSNAPAFPLSHLPKIKYTTFKTNLINQVSTKEFNRKISYSLLLTFQEEKIKREVDGNLFANLKYMLHLIFMF